MLGEGQGNEGSDKCSERAEDSWMQRVERNRDRGMRRGEDEGEEEGDGCTCASRARYRERRIPFPGSFPTRGRDEGRFGSGNPRYPRIREGYGVPLRIPTDSPTAGV